MEVARCILQLLQLFLHLLSTYTNMLHLLSSNQSFSCFLQLVSSISSSVGLVYVFHPLFVPLPLSKHLPQVISKHNHTTSYHLPLPAYLLFPSILACPSTPLYSSCPLYFTPHIALTIDLSALHKIATSFSLKHHILFPYNIVDLT